MTSILGLRSFRLVAAALIAASLFGVSAHAATPAGGWVVLGERQADLMQDRDRIVVGGVEGRFRELRFRVRGAPLEMYEMVITFGNDSQYRPKLKFNFDQGSSSRILDLPGERRFIKHVDFYYRTTARRQGRATITLYGR